MVVLRMLMLRVVMGRMIVHSLSFMRIVSRWVRVLMLVRGCHLVVIHGSASVCKSTDADSLTLLRAEYHIPFARLTKSVQPPLTAG
jgi:hypothetical protein